MLPGFLQDSSDPVLIVTSASAIVGFNRQAAQVLGLHNTKNPSLAQFLSEGEIKEMLRTTHGSAVDVHLQLPDSTRLHQVAFVLDLASAELSEQRLLVMFKSGGLSDFGQNRREEFLSTVAHDLKNPLGAIFGFSDALLDTDGEPAMSQKQRDVLARIRSTAMRCIDMVKNYQTLSSLQGGSLRIPPMPSNLNAVVRTVVESTWREGPEMPKLCLALASIDLPVRAERIMLDRIVSNLFSNALRYTPPRGTVTVGTRAELNQIFLEVHNTDAIIPAAEIPGIFDRHARASNSAGTTGSGLGLFIVKQITQLFGGQVQASSAEDVGTTFTVTLPLAHEEGILPVTG